MDGMINKKSIALFFQCGKASFNVFNKEKKIILLNINNFKKILFANKAVITQSLRELNQLEVLMFISLEDLKNTQENIVKQINLLVSEVRAIFKINVAIDLVFEHCGFEFEMYYLFNTNDFIKAQDILKIIIFNVERKCLKEVNELNNFFEKTKAIEKSCFLVQFLFQVESLLLLLLNQKNIIINTCCFLSNDKDRVLDQIRQVLHLDRVCRVCSSYLKNEKLIEKLKLYIFFVFTMFSILVCFFSYFEFKNSIDKSFVKIKSFKSNSNRSKKYSINRITNIYQSMILSEPELGFVFPVIKKISKKESEIIKKSANRLIWPYVKKKYQNKLNDLHEQWTLKSQDKKSITGVYYAFLIGARMMHDTRYYNEYFIKMLFKHLSLGNDKSLAFLSQIINDKKKHIIGDEYIKRVIDDLKLNHSTTNIYYLTQWYAEHNFNKNNVNDIVSAKVRDYFIGNAVSFMFTQSGYNHFVKPFLKGQKNQFLNFNWMASDVHYKLDINKRKFSELYRKDYMNAWSIFLKSLSYNSSKKLSLSQEKLIYKTIEKVLFELSILNNEEHFFYKKFKRIKYPFNILANNKNWKSYVFCLSKMNDILEGISSVDFEENNANDFAKQIMSGKVPTFNQIIILSNKLARQYFSDDLASSAQHFLLLPVRHAWETVLQQAARDLEIKWHESVYSFYETNIINKWPFSNINDQDDAILSRFLETNRGVLWRFVNLEFADYITMDATQWHSKTWLGKGLPFKDTFLKSLEKSYQLSQVLNNQQNLSRITLYINTEPTPGIAQYTMQLGDNKINYRNGPQEWQTINYALRDSYNHAELLIVATNGQEALISAHGNAALLHLLHQGTIHFLSDGTVQVSWSVTISAKKYTINILFRSERDILTLLLHDELNFKNEIFQKI